MRKDNVRPAQAGPGKKLAKAERREQLLETAMEVVRAKGADALTLAHVAECAGVSKPVAYEHFGTRSNLLVTLYRRIDERQIRVLREALEQTPPRLETIAEVISHAALNCHASTGPEWHAISAALKGSEEMEAVQRELIDRCIRLYCETLAPYTVLSDTDLQLRCAGFIGAAESISAEVIRGRVGLEQATANLAALVISGVSGD
ncbi:TetR/AcrR family transcriptional regulator [Vreelandella nigrificans]|uniref:TetR family transcriptional regulator n=1 Tax=Vreelandella nigrificans TaxID=2042704 RepID=A0A2A4HIP3_9GAMM|nr:TetR/AcrR family transcriptional regulator [Halomonas nigrificans]PCF93904.1 TetR family transcriptional regulator [Halomonas nigrificans]